MKLIPILFLFLLLLSCGNAKKNSDTSTSNSSSEVKDNTYRFIVSFISKGAGPDQKAKQSFSEFLSNYESTTKVKLSFDKFPWGREGESDYCFKLTELSKDKQVQFINDLKVKLGTSDLILYLENSVCRNKR